MFKWNSIPCLCPFVAILLFVGVDKFVPQILSTLTSYKANVNTGALLAMWLLNVSPYTSSELALNEDESRGWYVLL